MIREQATRIEPDEPQQPATGAAEAVGCLGIAIVFLAMCAVICIWPFAIAWMAGAI